MKIIVLEKDNNEVDIISLTKEFLNGEAYNLLIEEEYCEENEKLNDDELIEGFLSCWCQYDLDNIHYSVIDDENEVIINHLTPNDYEH